MSSVKIDLEASDGLVFRGCPDAVEPYLLANYRTASEALESGGQKQAAHAVRAAHHRARGEHTPRADAHECFGPAMGA